MILEISVYIFDYLFDNNSDSKIPLVQLINITPVLQQMNKTDPYNWSFPQKNQTMYLSTIKNNDFPSQPIQINRDSNFQKHDISGAVPKTLVPLNVNQQNYALSTYVQPRPQHFKEVSKKKVSDPLRIDDIEGARPRVNQFRTRRIVDPLCPKYTLSSCSQISLDPGRKFLRDTLSVQDINSKKRVILGGMQKRDFIQGSTPMARTKDLSSTKQNLDVKDINKDGIFESNRHINPLLPTYKWRDNDDKALNNGYGKIEGTQVKKLHPQTVNRANNLSLNVKDIEGATSNSTFARMHFLDKRRQFKNYMNIADIEKTNASSLKKGIQTKRQINPLMPNYQFLGHSQVKKN